MNSNSFIATETSSFYYWLLSEKFRCLPSEWAGQHPIQRWWLETMAWVEWRQLQDERQ